MYSAGREIDAQLPKVRQPPIPYEPGYTAVFKGEVQLNSANEKQESVLGMIQTYDLANFIKPYVILICIKRQPRIMANLIMIMYT